MENVLHVTHDAGFFSCSTIRLRKIIDYYNKNGVFPIVDSSKQWSYYKDEQGDITQILFENEDSSYHINRPITFSYDEREDQFSDYKKINYNDVSFFIEKYFKLSDNIREIKKKFIEKYSIEVKNTISICFRGNNKGRETYLPSHEQMLEKLRMVSKKHRERRILVQTDEKEFCEKVLLEYPNSIIIEELKQINNCDNDIQSLTPIGERLNLAVNILAAISIISETSHVVLNSGNVGMWICLFRKNVDNVDQFLSNKFL